MQPQQDRALGIVGVWWPWPPRFWQRSYVTFFQSGGGGAYYAPRISGLSYGPSRRPTLAMDDDLNWSRSQWGDIFCGALFWFLYKCVITRYFFRYHTFVWLYDFFIKMSRKHNRYRNWIQLQKIFCRNFFPQLIPIWINWWSYRGHISTVKKKSGNFIFT